MEFYLVIKFSIKFKLIFGFQSIQLFFNLSSLIGVYLLSIVTIPKFTLLNFNLYLLNLSKSRIGDLNKCIVFFCLNNFILIIFKSNKNKYKLRTLSVRFYFSSFT